MAHSAEAFVVACYRALLYRDPEPNGLYSHVQAIQSGRTLEATLQAFTASDEFKDKLAVRGYAERGAKGLLLGTSPELNVELLYPIEDQVQLPALMRGEPFQIDDLVAALDLCRDLGFQLPGDLFLDLGANVGSTVISAIALGEFERGLAVEAASENVRFLRANLALNKMHDRVSVLETALSDTVEAGYLWKNDQNCGDYRLLKSPQAGENEHPPPANGEEISTTTLDQLLADGSIRAQDVGFAWIDCQGSEGLIFAGSRRFFERVRVPMFLEFWPYGLSRLNCFDHYIMFIERYSSEIYMLEAVGFKRVTIDVCVQFYRENVENRKHVDLLLVPNT